MNHPSTPEYRKVEHPLIHQVLLIDRLRAHTGAFWARLARVEPDYEARRRWLADEGGAYDL